jgi:uncharacterized OB-fold protein
VPYAVAMIDLDEGVRIMTNIVDDAARRRFESACAWKCCSKQPARTSRFHFFARAVRADGRAQ